jgi:subtilisin family serine protease
VNSYHGTQVAGCIASNDNFIKGIAYGTKLLDADFAPAGMGLLPEACDWAHDNGAEIYNFSGGFEWDGGWKYDDCEYFDHIAYWWGRLPVCAAGNIPGGSIYVSSPANAYNVLAVGGIDDKNTAAWADDTIADFSSYKNPNTPHGDREKPEVCAPAVNIKTTLVGGGFDNRSGTSYAAPQVAGIAALLTEKNYGLASLPGLTKAIIMASAIHNVVGDPRMDDKEGVGTVDAYAAYRCLEGQGGIWAGYKYEADLPFDIYFTANAGQTVRFVITWYAHTDYSGSGDYGLCADLGLNIYKGWWPYGASNGYDRAWEIVQFTAPYTATYKARITALDHGAGDPWPFNTGEFIFAAWYIS